MDIKMDWKMYILVILIGIQIETLGRVLMVGQYFVCVIDFLGFQIKKHVTLSSTEYEYVDVSEASREIFFIKSLLEFLYVNFKRQISIIFDILKEIYLDKNSGGKSSKNIEVRYHHIREKISDVVVEIIFVKYEENIPDFS